jgi:hypothetical protein
MWRPLEASTVLAHNGRFLLIVVSIKRNIGGREDEIVFDVFVVCRNIFHKTKYREKRFESRACTSPAMVPVR